MMMMLRLMMLSMSIVLMAAKTITATITATSGYKVPRPSSMAQAKERYTTLNLLLGVDSPT
jgi:hypothetical protein